MHFRRKAFWVAKQILQLGMGDAFDDWLIEKIQLLRRGSVVASGIKRLELVPFCAICHYQRRRELILIAFSNFFLSMPSFYYYYFRVKALKLKLM